MMAKVQNTLSLSKNITMEKNRKIPNTSWDTNTNTNTKQVQVDSLVFFGNPILFTMG